MVHIFGSWYFGVSNYGEVCLMPFNTDANIGHLRLHLPEMLRSELFPVLPGELRTCN